MLAKSLLLSLLLGSSLAAQAQLSELSRDTKTNNLNNGYSLAPPEASGVQGSALLLPGWVPGQLLLAGNKAALAVPLKYDLYNMELRARRPVGDSVIVPLARVQEFTLTSGGLPRRFVCSLAGRPAEVRGGCGEVLYEAPAVQLLKFERKELVKQAADNGGYASTNVITKLEAQTAYYLRWTATGRYSPVRPRRASLEQALAGHPAAVAALKARKGGISSEAELVAALQDLNPQLAQ